ncbi:MAG TPA: hypothetical protein VGF42_01275 [Caulobacteraceae bacterium]|jgi:hypothetical protein
MIAFARFVMRDNGLAIHINTQQVTQVRQTTEGEPAIYIVGRETPMVVEGTLEAAIRKLEAAAAGLKVVEPAVEPMVETTPPVDQTPAPEMVAMESEATPQPEPEPEPEAAIAATSPGKAKPAKTKTETKAGTKAKPAKTKPGKPEASKAPEVPYPAASWFRGNR